MVQVALVVVQVGVADQKSFLGLWVGVLLPIDDNICVMGTQQCKKREGLKGSGGPFSTFSVNIFLLILL